MAMRRWQSHKVVEAEPIRVVDPSGSNLTLENGDNVVVPRDFFGRGAPAIGDYFVRYADGYVSWSPAAAFEEGYTLVEE